MAKWKRFVVGPNADGQSALLMEEAENVQEEEGIFYRATLWCTKETPVDNSIEGDRSMETMQRAPFANGMLCRALEIPPDTEDKTHHIEVLKKLNVDVQQKHTPSETEMGRHPSMHRTDTLDCITCVIGEIYLLTDVEEVLMKPGDTVVIRGTNHGWSNRSDKPCLLVGSMTDAIPA
ncbi:MAG: cupin domain-containing protein [Emcibacter sp.]|nr:cupin domain-containing protein [Emcibacter sp.]